MSSLLNGGSLKRNCWEIKNCGREMGGSKVDELGLCPAAVDTACDGINGGVNGGRICWANAGTLCGGIIQGTFVDKERTCSKCEVFQKIQEEEGYDFEILRL